MKLRIIFVSSVSAALLAGCAADTTNIQSAYVSPETYASYDCQQIGAEFNRLSRKAEELGAVVDKMASDDQAQAFVGIVLFWPALFFLEGGETQQTQEYARLKGQIEALETASVSKGCGTDIRQVAQYATPAASTTGKLESLKILYRDGAITEEEYVQRRKEISESSAREELRALEREKSESSAAAAASIAKISTGLTERTLSSEDGKLKVTVLPFATTRGVQATAEELAEFSRHMVNSEQSLTLKGEYPKPDEDAFWSSGFTDRRPVPDRVFDYLAKLDADIGVTYFYNKRTAGWYNQDLFTVDVYLFDGKNRRMHQRKADERSYKEITRQLLRAVARDQGTTLKN